MKQYFRAPWGAKLKLVTGVFLVVWIMALVQHSASGAVGLLVVALVALAFSVRGYSIGDRKLTIHRPGWVTNYDLEKLVSSEVVVGGLPGSIRTFGVGGLFAFAGYYWHPDLGRYRAYATDGTKAVLLDFGDEKVLVTPESPTRFSAAIRIQSRRQDP